MSQVQVVIQRITIVLLIPTIVHGKDCPKPKSYKHVSNEDETDERLDTINTSSRLMSGDAGSVFYHTRYITCLHIKQFCS